MYSKRLVSIILGVSFCFGAGASTAWADGCDGLDRNSKWVKLSKSLGQSIDNEDYETALDIVSSMQEICTRSPTLNYSAGIIYRKLGDETKALYYLQIATLNTEEFSVKGNMLEQIWYERYEAEHPMATEGSIQAYQEQIEKLTDENTLLSMSLNRSYDDFIEREYASMVAGISIGSAGILSAVAGGVVVGIMGSPVASAGTNKITYNGLRDLGWGFIGCGLGLTVAGSIMTGISGHRYITLKDKKNKYTVSFNVGMSGMEMRF